jgi:programmed cell death 8 (apoptosis-inducing factor)
MVVHDPEDMAPKAAEVTTDVKSEVVPEHADTASTAATSEASPAVKAEQASPIPTGSSGTPEAAPVAPVGPPLVDPESGLIKAHYVLVGGGTASYSAMKAIQERDPKADIWIITAESYVPYMRPPLSKELWFSEPEESTQLKFKDWAGESREYVHLHP